MEMTNEEVKEYFLKTANTKHLLSLYKRTHRASYYFDENTIIEKDDTKVFFMSKGGIVNAISLTRDELKTELSKREHIPNSIESKKLRQKLAKKYRKGFVGKRDKQK